MIMPLCRLVLEPGSMLLPCPRKAVSMAPHGTQSWLAWPQSWHPFFACISREDAGMAGGKWQLENAAASHGAHGREPHPRDGDSWRVAAKKERGRWQVASGKWACPRKPTRQIL